MALEIERKFLVTSDAWRAGAGAGVAIRQGYLSTDPGRTVRVRVAGARAVLTIKGPTSGATRLELEYPLPAADAEALLGLCLRPLVEKTRHRVPVAGHVWEVDVFAGANAGLVLAEVELADEAEAVALPSWVGREVTGDPRYANASLVAHPFARAPSPT